MLPRPTSPTFTCLLCSALGPPGLSLPGFPQDPANHRALKGAWERASGRLSLYCHFTFICETNVSLPACLEYKLLEVRGLTWHIDVAQEICADPWVLRDDTPEFWSTRKADVCCSCDGQGVSTWAQNQGSGGGVRAWGTRLQGGDGHKGRR